MAENLILYYSRKGQNYVNGKICDLPVGNSAQLAGYIQEAVGGDLFEIQTVSPYPEDYMACTEVAKKELKENARPKLQEYLQDVSGYSRIFLLGPCWWGTYPMAVFTLLETLDFSGKQIYPVMTHEGSGSGSCEKDLKKLCKGAKIARCLAVMGSKVPASRQQVQEWAQKMMR